MYIDNFFIYLIIIYLTVSSLFTFPYLVMQSKLNKDKYEIVFNLACSVGFCFILAPLLVALIAKEDADEAVDIEV